MKFRPCIDLHNGLVKQIVGSSLGDSVVRENFVAKEGADHFALLYKKDGLSGGHVIMLGPGNEEQALLALGAYPGGLQIGGGINADNAGHYLDKGASHIIVTSHVFRQGRIDFQRLEELKKRVGKNRIVIDLSSRKKAGDYYIVTDRWTQFTDCKITSETLDIFSSYCDEFLVHAVDVEGKNSGIELDLLKILSQYSPIMTTYAGGIKSLEDIRLIEEFGKAQIDFTVGSSLDLFGGPLSYEELVKNFG
ncbi:MAG: phosphoribosylformimino-5-aminoimidazole carboxamide ribotide isomerase [Spirochaetales bacterium]|nr:phosphoribosylformimino-5-aminoimidazole carboxamide ribotide isomerase [Spirochaetales bacterium]